MNGIDPRVHIRFKGLVDEEALEAIGQSVGETGTITITIDGPVTKEDLELVAEMAKEWHKEHPEKMIVTVEKDQSE